MLSIVTLTLSLKSVKVQCFVFVNNFIMSLDQKYDEFMEGVMLERRLDREMRLFIGMYCVEREIGKYN